MGAYIAPSLEADNYQVTRTSRRSNCAGGAITFDLETGRTEDLLAVKPHIALVCAAITNMRACEDDPIATRRVNVASTLTLIEDLLDHGVFVVFLSSNTVFDGRTLWPDELTPYAPVTEYGRQKVEVEKRLREHPDATHLLAIVRISKVLARRTGMTREFTSALRAGKVCRAFNDLMLSPASLPYIGEGLTHIATGRHPGIFHLSGAAEISYTDLAISLAERIGADKAMIQPVCSADAGIEVLFKPQHPGLGMSITMRQLGIEPEPIDHVLDALCQHDG